MTVWAELFKELFFGTYGGWLGAIILMSLILVVSYRIKYTGLCFIPVSLLIGMWYLDYVDVNSNLVFNAILFFMLPILLIFMLYDQKKK